MACDCSCLGYLCDVASNWGQMQASPLLTLVTQTHVLLHSILVYSCFLIMRRKEVRQRQPHSLMFSFQLSRNVLCTDMFLSSKIFFFEMQNYLFWFPSLFLEILCWFIKHRNSQHLKQTFKTPM